MSDEASLDLVDTPDAWTAVLAYGGKPGAYRLIVKADFLINAKGELDPVQAEPLSLTDHYMGEPGRSSVAVAGEAHEGSGGRAFYVTGELAADASGTVGVEVHSVDGQTGTKYLTVREARQWRRGLLRMKPEPVEAEALDAGWGQAYGGVCPETDEVHPSNPVGTGFRFRGRPAEGENLPRLFAADDSGNRPGHATRPDAVGPMPESMWRDSEEGLSGPAPVDQRLSGHWQAGDCLRLSGLLSEVLGSSLELRLPRFAPQAVLVGSGRADMLDGHCDTVVIDTRGRLSLIWRSAFARPKPVSRPAWVVFHSD